MNDYGDNYSLNLIIGPMYSGKSTELLRRKEECLKNNNLELVISVNHTFDNRYGSNKIITHDNKSSPCMQLTKIEQLSKLCDLSKIKYLFIDEGQFFENLYDDILYLIKKYNIHITIAGLDSDYNMKPFENSNMLNLIPYCKKITKLNSKCVNCNKNAETTYRLNNNSNSQIIVGSSDLYKPICFKCRLIL